MQYFNAVVRRYNHQRNKNFRFIYFQNLHSKCTSRKELEKFSAIRSSRVITEAEKAEAIKRSGERDIKQEAVARAKKKIKEIVRHNYNPNLKLLTLTYGYIVHSKVKVLNDIKNMAKRYREHTGIELKYIASLEWQEPRKCLHVHMVVDSPYITAFDWSKFYWQQGFIKINTISYGKSQSECMSAVMYILKYISKCMDSCDYYNHLYFRSRNWDMPYDVAHYVDGTEKDMIRYCNLEYGNNNYIMSRFFFESYDGYIINIIDVYPKCKDT